MKFEPETSQTLLRIALHCMNMPLEKGQAAIQSALAQVGKLLSADRGYIFDYDFKEQIAINTYEWCSHGIEPQIDTLQHSPLDAAPDWVASHLKGEPVIIADVAALAQSDMKDILDQQNINSLISVPIFFKGQLRGFIGFDAVKSKQTYSVSDIELIRFLGEILISFKTRVNAERELKNANNRLEAKVRKRTLELEKLNKKLVQSEENEKKLLASDLHDNSIQIIAHCISKLKGIRASEHEIDREGLYTVQEHLGQVADELRSLIFKLSPPIIEDFDLDTTLRFLVDDTNTKQNSKFKYENCCDAHLELSYTKKIAVYRIVKELINNILRHSGSDEGRITLSDTQNEMVISVEDPGCGFDPEMINTSADHKFGLTAVKERIGNLNGRIHMASSPGNGTKISLMIPA